MSVLGTYRHVNSLISAIRSTLNDELGQLPETNERDLGCTVLAAIFWAIALEQDAAHRELWEYSTAQRIALAVRNDHSALIKRPFNSNLKEDWIVMQTKRTSCIDAVSKGTLDHVARLLGARGRDEVALCVARFDAILRKVSRQLASSLAEIWEGAMQPTDEDRQIPLPFVLAAEEPPEPKKKQRRRVSKPAMH